MLERLPDVIQAANGPGWFAFPTPSRCLLEGEAQRPGLFQTLPLAGVGFVSLDLICPSCIMKSPQVPPRFLDGGQQTSPCRRDRRLGARLEITGKPGAWRCLRRRHTCYRTPEERMPPTRRKLRRGRGTGEKQEAPEFHGKSLKR